MRSFPSQEFIFLTFDDGPDPETTPHVLDRLKEGGVRATFFVIAEKAERFPLLIERIVKEGHRLGNHSSNHQYKGYFQSVERTKHWVLDAKKRIESLSGSKTVGFRPPAGVRTPVLHKALNEIDIPMIYWSKRFFDTRFLFDSKKAEKAAGSLSAGDIVLLHDLQTQEKRSAFLEGLSTFIRSTHLRGRSFSLLPQKG